MPESDRGFEIGKSRAR